MTISSTSFTLPPEPSHSVIDIEMPQSGPLSSPLGGDSLALKEEGPLPYGSLRVSKHKSRMQADEAKTLANLLYKGEKGEKGPFQEFLGDLNHEKPRTKRQMVPGAFEFCVTTPVAVAAYPVELGWLALKKLGGAGHSLYTEVASKLQGDPRPDGSNPRDCSKADESQSHHDREATFGKIDALLSEGPAHVGWTGFTNQYDESLSPNDARAHLFAILHHPEIRTFVDQALATPRWRDLSKVSAYLVGPAEISQLAKAFVQLPVQYGEDAPERIISHTQIAVSGLSARRPRSLTRSHPRTPVPKTKDVEELQDIEQIKEHAQSLTLAATDGEVKDLVDSLGSEHSPLNRLGSAASTWLHSWVQSEIGEAELADCFIRGNMPPLNHPYLVGLLKPGPSTVVVKGTTYRGQFKHAMKVAWRYLRPSKPLLPLTNATVKATKQGHTLATLPFTVISTDPSYQVYLGNILKEAVAAHHGHLPLPAVSEDTALVLTMQDKQFRKNIYSKIYTIFSATPVVNAKGVEVPEYASVIRPFLERVIAQGKDGVEMGNAEQRRAYEILEGNHVHVASSNQELQEELQKLFDHPSEEMRKQHVQHTALSVLNEYLGGEFAGKEATVDLLKGMTLGTAASAGINKGTNGGGTLAQILNTFCATGSDIVLDNIPTARINTRDVAEAAGVPFTEANLYGQQPSNTTEGLAIKQGRINKICSSFPAVRLVVSGDAKGARLGRVYAANLRSAVKGGVLGMVGSAIAAIPFSQKTKNKIYLRQIAKCFAASWGCGYLTGTAALFSTGATVRRTENIYSQQLKNGKANLPREVLRQYINAESKRKARGVLRTHIRSVGIHEVSSLRTNRAQVKGLMMGPFLVSLGWLIAMAKMGLRKAVQPIQFGLFPAEENFGYSGGLAASAVQIPRTADQLRLSLHVAQSLHQTDNPAFVSALHNSFTDTFARFGVRIADIATHPFASMAELVGHPFTRDILDPLDREILKHHSKRQVDEEAPEEIQEDDWMRHGDEEAPEEIHRDDWMRHGDESPEHLKPSRHWDSLEIIEVDETAPNALVAQLDRARHS